MIDPPFLLFCRRLCYRWQLTLRCTLWMLVLILSCVVVAQEPEIRTQPQPQRELDDQVGFRILVWQFQNDAQRDAELYRQVNLGGFHIDYGAGQESRVAWAREQNWPYYVDHAAGKGILHLTPRSGLNDIPRDGEPAARPWSFFDPATRKELHDRLARNVPPVATGPVLAIALDDEVSLGTFNSPLEIDFSELALENFRQWLPTQYDDPATFRSSWRLTNGEQPRPETFEGVRTQLTSQPPAAWRLARWMDFRSFMDESQAATFADLVRQTNQLAPGVPTGVVGGQQPSAYGGFDYARLRHALQWTEAYDIGGTNEILHSFWSTAPRRGRMQTYFLSGNLGHDKWFLWYYLAHGNRGVIAWPAWKENAWFRDGKVHPHVQRLAPTFAAVQQPALGVLAHPATQPIFSPIAILYSHPSVQLGWAIDATAHGKTWPRRSSSLDNACLSSGKNRVAWTRLLEDLGYQARFIDTQEIEAGDLSKHGCQVLVLPQAFALSRQTCAAITEFARNGGMVIADYGTAITDEHGNGYDPSPMDSLFGIDRTRDQGWFDGRRRYEINGEAYQLPFMQRLPQEGLMRDRDLTVVERSLGKTRLTQRSGQGSAWFLNTSPTAYFDADQRAGVFGRTWRQLLGDLLKQHKVQPEVRLVQAGGADFGVELLRYRSAEGREIWAITTNPTRQASIDRAANDLQLSRQPIALRVQTDRQSFQLKDLRTGQLVGQDLQLPADEALVLEVIEKSR